MAGYVRGIFHLSVYRWLVTITTTGTCLLCFIPNQYHLFYRLDNGKYLVVIVKRALTGNYFSTMYSTGNAIRNTHKSLKEIKL